MTVPLQNFGISSGMASPPRRDLRHQPDARALEVVAPERFAVTQPARADLDCLDVFLIVAVVGDELRAAVRTVHFERALGSCPFGRVGAEA